MGRVDFYHLKNAKIYFAVGKLIEKVIDQKERVLVRTDSQIVSEEIDEFLWSYDLSNFLPHGKLGDPNSKYNPIHITNEEDNPNNANILFIISTSKLSVAEIVKFKRTFILFSDGDLNFFEPARQIWKELGHLEINRNYWAQEKSGWTLRDFI